MELLLWFWDVIVHLDKHLAVLLQQYGGWIYLVLFLIVFCETGLVVTPFLPGDSLLFVAGTLWATAGMPIELLAGVLIMAALCGDNVNYWVGRYIGPRVFRWEQSRWFNRRALDMTHGFYERHGGKTIVIARYVPLVRTFAPFVAGVGRMGYPRFLAFSAFAAALWVVSLTGTGYLFGNIAIVRENLTLVIFGIIGLSLAPLGVGYLRHRTQRAA
ncbi:MAG: DedA family protein [Burkholderiales bacterium]|nr:DedA family protein [Burkholderiales bacterium]